MSKKKVIEKNIELSSKVASFIVENPQLLENIPNNASFVIFSTSFPDLNKNNDELISSLKEEGKSVVKVVETENPSKPWQFLAA